MVTISNNQEVYSSSASIAEEITAASQSLSLNEGAVEACGALIPILETDYQFLSLSQSDKTISVTTQFSSEQTSYETGYYEDIEIKVVSQNYSDLFFTIPVTVFWQNPAQQEIAAEQLGDTGVGTGVESETDLEIEEETLPGEENISGAVSPQLTKEELVKNIFELTTKEEVTENLANLLEVKDADTVVAGTEIVIEITDDTDLTAAAKFDIFGFFNDRGLLNQATPKGKEGLGSPPDFVLENQLKDTFSLPFSKDGIRQDGQVFLDFQAGIEKKNLTNLVDQFVEEDSETQRALRHWRSLQSSSSFKNDGEGGTTLETGQTLLQTQQLFKLTQSINCTLVPGDDSYLDKKGFIRKLVVYDNDQIGFKFEFEHPAYISVGKPDTMKIEFFNTEKVFKPQNRQLQPMPDGYMMTQKIPPQGIGLLSQEEVQTVQETGQALVFTNLFISFVLKSTLQLLLGSIIIFQILAHLPLADLSLPANTLQQFDIMIQFVSFDFFSPTEYIDAGFTETPAWSERFDWVGYSSVNFFENMGSILIFALYAILLLLFSLVFQPLRRALCSTRFATRLQVGAQAQNLLLFIHSTFFEILICVSTSVIMVKNYDWLVKVDHIAIFSAGIFALILIAYFAFVVYFSFAMTSKISHQSRGQQEEQRKHLIAEVHKKVLDKRIEHYGQIEGQKSSELLEEIGNGRAETTKTGKKVQISKLDFYNSLLNGLRKDKRAAMFSQMIIQVRRLSLLYMAMFVLEMQWLQVSLFLLMNLLSLCFAIVVMPNESARMNYVSIMNESLVLFLSYPILLIQDLSNRLEVREQIGNIIVYTIYLAWVCNGIVILFFSVKEIYMKVKDFYQRRRIAENSKEQTHRQQIRREYLAAVNQLESPQNPQLDAIEEEDEPESDESERKEEVEVDDFPISQPVAQYVSDQKIPLKARHQGTATLEKHENVVDHNQGKTDILDQIDEIFESYDVRTYRARRAMSVYANTQQR